MVAIEKKTGKITKTIPGLAVPGALTQRMQQRIGYKNQIPKWPT